MKWKASGEDVEPDPDERPKIRVLMALPSLSNPARPATTKVVDLLDVPRFRTIGFKVVALDPDDHDAFVEWRKRHPEAS